MTPEWLAWDRRESGPTNAVHTVLCRPGGLCTAMSYQELMGRTNPR